MKFGDMFPVNGQHEVFDLIIIQTCRYMVQLVDRTTWNRYANPVKVSNTFDISKQEFIQLFDGYIPLNLEDLLDRFFPESLKEKIERFKKSERFIYESKGPKNLYVTIKFKDGSVLTKCAGTPELVWQSVFDSIDNGDLLF